MFRRTGRIGLILSLACASLVQISAPIASAVTTDCSISSGQFCRATFTYTGARESWTIPAGITSITVDVVGAAGGNGTSLGGKGARMQGTITTTPGNTLYLYVGQQGPQGALSSNTGYVTPATYLGGGGGGGSFLLTQTNSSPLIVAGGGGGGMGPCCGVGQSFYDPNPGLDASTSTSGVAAGSISGAAGTGGLGGYGGNAGGGSAAGAGGGILSDGGAGTSAGQQGRSLANGLTGGVAVASCNASWGTGGNGGFGGGGAACGGAGGGGGGYSGGGGGGGSTNWGPGGGGGSYLDASVTTTTSTSGFGTSNGYVTITYLNAPTPTVFTSSQSARTNTSSAITFSLTFSQNVNLVANSDFSNAGTATGCTFSISASSGTSFTLTASSCSEGTLVPQVLANSVFGTTTSTYGPGSNSLTTTPITIDRTVPTISSVAAPPNSLNIPSNHIIFNIIFSESITVTGTPRLTLTVGTQTKYANYLSMIDSKTARFRYTVGFVIGEFDTDGIEVATSIDLNAGAINDLASNALTNLTFTAPTLTLVLVAQKPDAPTIDSITATSGQLAIYFTPSASNGSAISNYQYSTNNGATWTARSPDAITSPITITGLTNGTTYPVRIRAQNGPGAGESSSVVNATPSAVVVAGGSNISITQGQSGSSSLFTATGGTGVYAFTLSSTPSGVSISDAVVSVDSTTAAGTYTLNVVATDNSGTPQSGFKPFTIIVSKATTSITISLPNGSADAALGGAITITATTSKPGSVTFKLGGSNISGCGTVATTGTTATCSWTPGALGSVSLTAAFSPTDSSNFETSTTTTLSITVVNGVSSVTLSLAGGTTTPPKGQTINIIAAVDQAGRITFMIDGKRIPGCNNRVANVGNVTCSWKPAIQKQSTITGRLVPTNNVYNPSTSSLNVRVIKRTGTR